MNCLNILDTTLFVDDEENKVLKDNIDKFISQLERDVNVFGFNPQKKYAEFEDSVMENTERVNKLSDPTIAFHDAEFALFRVALNWIYFWGTCSDANHRNYNTQDFYLCVDGRNEIAVNRCREICDMPEFNKLLNFYSTEVDYSQKMYFQDDINKQVIFYMMKMINGRMHKTNTQTATGFMFYALTSIKKKKKNAQAIYDKLVEKYGERYYSLPMI